jgi:PAS domain S-box-containing protein
MPWGTHFCHFYETKQDLLDTLVPYFKAGLESKEFCVWVVSDSELISVAEAKAALAQAVPDLGRHLADENIEILNGLDWYLEENVFTLERVTRAWDAKLKRALARGYDGMRVSGDTFWLTEKDWKDFFAYEKQLNESIVDQPMTVLCTYPLAKSGAGEVLDVVQAHQFAIARRQGEWEIVETPELIQAKAEIERLNEELEQRVIERTRELAAANEELRKEIAERKRAEDALRRSEDRLRLVIDTVPALIHTGLPDGQLDFFNQRWLDFVGLSLEDLSGWKWTAAIHPEDVAAMVERWRAALATGEPYEHEARVRRADGEYRCMVHREVPLRDERGNIVKWYASSIDIEDRKRAEDALRQSEERFAAFMDNLPGYAWMKDLQGRYVYVNEMVRGLPGYRSLGKTDAQIWPADLAAVYRANDQQVIAAKKPLHTLEHFQLEGKHRYMAGSKFPIFDKTSAVALVGGVGVDITERIEAEEAVRRSEEHLRLVIDTIPVMAWTVRPDGVVDFLNQRWLDYAGLSFEQYIENPTGPIHPEDIPRVMEKWRAAMAAGERYEAEMRLQRADGEYRWFLVRTAPLRDEQGSLVKWYGVSTDIEELKRADAALKESQQRLEEAQRVAHVGHWDRDLETGRIRWSDEICRILGLPLQERDSIRTEWLDVVHPDDRPRLSLAIEEMQRGIRRFDVEFRIVRPTGEVRFLHSQGDVIRDELGRPLRRFGTAQDITERRSAEDELKKEKEILEKIFDNIPVMIGFVSEEGQVKLVNPEWERTIGWTLKELQEQNVDIFAEAYPDPSYRQEVLDFVAASTGEWVDLKIKVRDGRVIDAACAVVHLSDGTRVAIAKDITERKEAEEKLKATSEQLRALSASLQAAREGEGTRIARELHDELGGALTSLKWDLESFAKVISESPDQSQLQLLREKIKAMLRLTDITIDAVRRISSELRPSVLDDLGLTEAIEWQAGQFQARTGIICHCECSVENVDLNKEQSTAVFRIFQEALTNILRHAQATRVDIAMKEKTGEFVLTVNDNGRGITDDDKSRPGSLGLLGMRERAHMIGGEIDITGIGGQGTVVTVRVPISKRVMRTGPPVK